MRPNKLTPGYNLRWESSRMMIPEHKFADIERKRQQSLVKKPLLDDQTLTELNETVCDAIARNRLLYFRYFKDGEILHIAGKVNRFDAAFKQLRICDIHGEVQILDVEAILDAKMER